ncbi:MAG: nitroreductase family protein [Candidatus Bathyarchaeia archaeon]
MANHREEFTEGTVNLRWVVMDTYTCIRTRREIRDYLDKPIPNETVQRILEAGRLAPSSKNSQPWHFIVIKDRMTLKKVSELTPTGAHIAKAAMAIAILMDAAKLPEIDGARAVQNMVLEAWEMGVGSCWVTNFYDDGVKDLLGVPQRMKLITVMPFGYPIELKTKRKKIRKPLSEIVHSEKFGQPFSTSKS